MLEDIKRVCEIKEQDVRSYSPLALAYLGDGVYELVVRTVILEWANRPVAQLHKLATKYVNAAAQAQIIRVLQDELTQEEADIVRRGRNAKPYTTAKNASRADYHKATGFEALMGYLYLTGQTERMLLLIKRGMAVVDGENENG